MSFLEWKPLAAHQTARIRSALIKICDSIWYSTHYNASQGENGMVEYCTKTNKIVNTIKYTNNSKPIGHSCCEYKNKIYIVDGYAGKIIVFDPLKKTFIKTRRMNQIGFGACCVVVHDCIHIFHGVKNRKHLIYSITNDKLQFSNSDMTDELTISNIKAVSILKYNDKIIRFGGFNADKKRNINKFTMSSTIIADKYNDIEWLVKKNYKLKEPAAQCGYLLYKHYILRFGGFYKEFMDTIYLLDLNQDNGWIKLNHVRCPMASQYLAILDSNNYIHLFTTINKFPKWSDSVNKHYSIAIYAIFRAIYRKQLQLLSAWNFVRQSVHDVAPEIKNLCLSFVGETFDQIMSTVNKQYKSKKRNDTNEEATCRIKVTNFNILNTNIFEDLMDIFSVFGNLYNIEIDVDEKAEPFSVVTFRTVDD
eukprot:379656_1